MENSTHPLLNFEEACHLLRIKQSRLRTAVLKRDIPYIKIGRLIRFDIKDLTNWIESLKNQQSKKA
jgi:excisionase family DNA binding protein